LFGKLTVGIDKLVEANQNNYFLFLGKSFVNFLADAEDANGILYRCEFRF
jgi:hypothetical protein